MIVNRDRMNTGMEQKEVIQNIVEMASTTYAIAETDYKYLVWAFKFRGLKRGGLVSKAQPTTTKHSQITAIQQLRWYTVVDTTWDRMRITNLPLDRFAKLIEHFQLNLDETCIMANAGSLFIIASQAKSKTEKRNHDSRISLTAIRIGNAAGNEGLGFSYTRQRRRVILEFIRH
jgi:hypothetical protein